MPEFGSYQCGFWDADPRRWERCVAQATTDLLARGWRKPLRNSTYEYKFNRARNRRARKLWGEG